MEDKKNIKKNIILIIIAIIIYTVIVVQITLKIYTKVLNDAFQNITIDSEFENNVNTENDEHNISDISISTNSSNDNNTVKINLNDVISKDSKYEISVIGYNFSKKILPPNTSGYYSYYEAKEDGHQYLDIKLNYKNLAGSEIDADEVGSIKIKFADKYEYTSFSIIEDSDGDFTYSNITPIAPLTTGKLHYLFDIPDEVANSSESIVAYITVGTENYELVIR